MLLLKEADYSIFFVTLVRDSLLIIFSNFFGCVMALLIQVNEGFVYELMLQLIRNLINTCFDENTEVLPLWRPTMETYYRKVL